jgi:AcrR family transcriptional regulator
MVSGTLETLKQKEKDARRELILRTARELFSEKDFRRVTVREIARKVKVSPGTIYLYYENLDELFLDVFFAGAREIMDRIDAEWQTNGRCTLHRFCQIYIATLNENMSFYQMMGHFMLGGKTSEETAGRLNRVMRELMDRVENIIREAGLRGETRLLSHALFASLNGIMISYARYPARSPQEIKRHTSRLAGIIASLFEQPSSAEGKAG